MGNFMLIMWKDKHFSLFDLHIFKVSENWMKMKYGGGIFGYFIGFLSVGDLNAMMMCFSFHKIRFIHIININTILQSVSFALCKKKKLFPAQATKLVI